MQIHASGTPASYPALDQPCACAGISSGSRMEALKEKCRLQESGYHRSSLQEKRGDWGAED